MDLDLSTPAERLLVDPRLGLLTAVTRQPPQPGVPAAWVGYGAHVADTTAYAPWTVDRYGFGAALGDPDRARRAAIGASAPCGVQRRRRTGTRDVASRGAAGRQKLYGMLRAPLKHASRTVG